MRHRVDHKTRVFAGFLEIVEESFLYVWRNEAERPAKRVVGLGIFRFAGEPAFV